MLNKKVVLPLIAAVLMALGINLEKLGIDLDALLGGDAGQSSQVSNSNSSASTSSVARYKSGEKWSTTSPNINLHHIFEGEINRSERPVGYHSRPGGVDANGAKIVKIIDKPNEYGIYTATIAIRDGSQWKEKFSSFFPDSMSADEVMSVILNAYKNSSNPKAQPWRGPSGLGFSIEGYTSSRGGINTAFPIY